MSTGEESNRLIDETSPYLLQHAHNPVDWQPWDERALEEARDEDKPIFLSIGYSACHWCHVMERESFENEEIAAYLNEHFVPIKVDREERPDLDRIYMNATQMLTGQGGWPMSVFLTPDLEPFYAGTYFPPDDKWGRPGFETVLSRIVELWEEERERVEGIGEELTERIDRASRSESSEEELGREPLSSAYQTWRHRFDRQNGGFGSAPKFPPAMQLRALLQVHADESVDGEGDGAALEMVETTLVRMASGGLYDQIGGGFHRYSVDERWLVPHFEKMLYDNALLTLTYVDAYRITGRAFYRRIVDETLGYVLREMTDESQEAGRPFYSTQDAESEGEEGKYFIWTPQMLREVLEEEEAERAEQYWGISESGNFENDWSIPNRLSALDEEGLEVAFEELSDDIREIRQTLFDARTDRVPPGTDTKILAAWNGLMIRAFAHAGFYLDESRYIEAAESAAEFVFEEMVEGSIEGEFELMRTFKDGRARVTGYLDDYAGVAAGAVALFEATGDPDWLERGVRMVERSIELFWDEEGAGGFFYTGDHHEHLIVRDKDQIDNATPSGNSLAIGNLLRLSSITGRTDFRDRAHQALGVFFARMRQSPQAMGEMLQALHYHLGEPLELVVLRSQEDDGELLDVIRDVYLPHAVRVLAMVDSETAGELAEQTELLEGRERIDDAPTAYVCRGGTCRAPTADPDTLRDQLETG